jgi:hypothetical protein
MSQLILDDNVLLCFSDFIALYIDDIPELDEVRQYIETQLIDKDIAESYNSKIITQDEICSFISSHLFTKFILGNKEVRHVDDYEIEKFYRKLKKIWDTPPLNKGAV